MLYPLLREEQLGLAMIDVLYSDNIYIVCILDKKIRTMIEEQIYLYQSMKEKDILTNW
jgi:hypothetical protein